MQAVAGEVGVAAGRRGLGHRREVVEIDVAVRAGVVGQPAVERGDRSRSARDLVWTIGWPAAFFLSSRDRQQRGQHDPDAVGAGQLGHRRQVVLRRSGDVGPALPATSFVPARITTARGLQLDHVGSEAHQHLRGRLAADAAVDVGLAGEEAAAICGCDQLSVIESPKNTTRALARRGGHERGVGRGEAREAAEVEGDEVETRDRSSPAKRAQPLGQTGYFRSAGGGAY